MWSADSLPKHDHNVILANASGIFSDCTRLPETALSDSDRSEAKLGINHSHKGMAQKSPCFAVTVMRKLMQQSHTSSCEDKIKCHSVRRVALPGHLW